MPNLSVNISGSGAVVADSVTAADVTTTDDLVVGDDADVVGSLTAGDMASDTTVQGTRLLATANGTAADPFVEGPNNTGIYILDGTSSALCQGGGAWMTFGTAGIVLLNHRVQIAHGYASGGVLSPAQITSNQTDYNPFGGNMHLYHNIRISLDANRTINSLQPPPVDGCELVFWNTSAFTLTLLHDDGATGTAGARFLCPNNANYAVRQNGAVIVRYDSTSSRWRVLAA